MRCPSCEREDPEGLSSCTGCRRRSRSSDDRVRDARPAARGPLPRALRDPGPARAGGHGHRLQGPRPLARRGGRDQGAPSRLRARPAHGPALQVGDPPRAPRAPPQRLHDPRLRGGGRPALHLDGAHPGSGPEADRPRAGRAADRPRLRRAPPGGRRPPGRPRGGHHPPRPEDAEHPPRAERGGAPHGLRHRQAGGLRRGRDRHRPGRGDAGVHEPRAGPGAEARRPHRRVLAGSRRLRDPHRAGPVQGRDPDLDDPQAHPRPAAPRRPTGGPAAARAA